MTMNEMLKNIVHNKVNEIFVEYQNASYIASGDIEPFDAECLDRLEEELANHIEKVFVKQSKNINYDAFAPSWYVYTDDSGEFHDVVYGYDNINEFFTDVSYRIAFDDCSGETVHKIYYKGKEVEYVGWQPGMKYEYADLDGNTVWVGVFEHWDH